MALGNSNTLGKTERPVPAAARTASGNTGPLVNYGHFDALRAQLDVAAASGTSPTLVVIIEDSLDGGNTWNAIGTFTQKTAAGREVINIPAPFAPLLRISWTIGGTTPSFTFAVDWYGQA